MNLFDSICKARNCFQKVKMSYLKWSLKKKKLRRKCDSVTMTPRVVETNWFQLQLRWFIAFYNGKEKRYRMRTPLNPPKKNIYNSMNKKKNGIFFSSLFSSHCCIRVTDQNALTNDGNENKSRFVMTMNLKNVFKWKAKEEEKERETNKKPIINLVCWWPRRNERREKKHTRYQK